MVEYTDHFKLRCRTLLSILSVAFTLHLSFLTLEQRDKNKLLGPSARVIHWTDTYVTHFELAIVCAITNKNISGVSFAQENFFIGLLQYCTKEVWRDNELTLPYFSPV
jgi:hypothetical protein